MGDASFSIRTPVAIFVESLGFPHSRKELDLDVLSEVFDELADASILGQETSRLLYVLGMIMGDGSICDKPEYKTKQLSVALHFKMEELFKKILWEAFTVQWNKGRKDLQEVQAKKGCILLRILSPA